MSEDNRKIVFWSESKEVEFLYHKELGDLIGERVNWGIKDGKIKVYGWARKIVDQEDLAQYVMDVVGEHIDEEYFFEDPHEPCEKIKEGAREFARIYAENIEPYYCEIVHEEIIDIEKWIKDQPNDA